MLIIVESPAKAKTISKIVGKNHIVKASIGHIRKISDDKKTPDGRKLEINGIDIDQDFFPIFEIDPGKKDVVIELKKLAKSAKDGILFATDSDREGEAISWHLSEILGIKDKSKIKRLEFHEITQKAIKEAMEHPRELNIQLVTAQQARQVLDKLVGYKLSPVLWNVMGNYNLSAGRVQSPALRLVCEREKEILSFIPQEYWDIFGSFQAKTTEKAEVKWNLHNDESEEKAENEEENRLRFTLSQGKKLPKEVESKAMVESLISGLDQQTQFTVKSVSISKESSKTRPPFITSTLQQAASSKLGYAPRLTMQLAQKLYEGIDIDGQPTALITYMRTDSVNLSNESIEAARTYLKNQFPKQLPTQARRYKSKSRNAQEAHEAIRPINPLLSPNQLKGKLDSKLLKLYELIWTQMLASQMTDEYRERFNFDLQNERADQFSGSIAWTTDPGFKALTGEKTLKKPEIDIKEGQVMYLKTIENFQHFTKPPSRYSPASLIKKLEQLGIGRPSTYASIISTLNDREYVNTEKNVMKPTTLGMKVNDLLSTNFTDVTGSELTAKMEEDLDEISRGDKEYAQVLRDFWQKFKHEVETKSGVLKEQRDQYRRTETEEKCPVCLGEMELKLGRFGEYFQCLNHREHQFPKNYKEYNAALAAAQEQFGEQTKGKKCEECGKDLIVRVSKSSLQPYIACPEYKVGNKHSITDVNYGPCPKCQKEGRTSDKQGFLVRKRGFRGKSFIGCSLPKDTCGYIQKSN